MLRKVSSRLIKAFESDIYPTNKRPIELVYDPTAEVPTEAPATGGAPQGTPGPKAENDGVIDRGYKPPPKIKPPRRTDNNITDTNEYYASYMSERRQNGEDL